MTTTASKPTDKLGAQMVSHLADFEFSGAQSSPDSEIVRFYSGRSVFITGATGFIGKVLVEKLLRSCPDIRQIYVLIRDKRGKSSRERLDELIDSPIFERVRQMAGGREPLAAKLTAVQGDITLEGFGLSETELAELSRQVSVVFNSAATIRFVEPIDVAVRNNIHSVSQLMSVCDKLHKLEALIHLSTAYSNCHKRDTIHEILYEPPMSGAEIINASGELRRLESQIHSYPSRRSRASSFIETGEDVGEENDEALERARSSCKPQVFERTGYGNCATQEGDLLDRFAQFALERSNRPNTYTFTKAIAESHLFELASARADRYLSGDRKEQVRLAIVRPSIVGGAWREPFVGFVDNYNGPTGAVLALYTGALQAMPGSAEMVSDVVPVDMVANAILSIGWFLVAKKEEEEEEEETNHRNQIDGQDSKVNRKCERIVRRDRGIYVFNYVSGYRNPLRWGMFTSTIKQLAYQYPSKQLVRLPASYFVRAGSLYRLYDFLNHRLPAHLVDLVSSLSNFFGYSGIVNSTSGSQQSKQTSALSAYSKIRSMTDMLTPFTSHQWLLSDANTLALYNCLSATDKRLFEFDVGKIEWAAYIRNYIIGSRLYTLRDGPENVTKASRRIQKRLNIGRAMALILILLFYYLFLHAGQLERSLVGAVGRLM